MNVRRFEFVEIAYSPLHATELGRKLSIIYDPVEKRSWMLVERSAYNPWCRTGAL